MLLKADESKPEHRSGRKVKGNSSFYPDQVLENLVAAVALQKRKIYHRQGNRRRRGDLLNRLPGLRGIGGPEDLVAATNLLEGPLEGGNREGAR